MYPTWRRVTSSNDFKLCGSSISIMTRRRVMYVASPLITPLSSNTAGVSNACIKTFLLCSRRREPPSAVRVWTRIDNPARWTVDSRRWCGWTELLSCVCVIVSHINTQTSIVLILLVFCNITCRQSRSSITIGWLSCPIVVTNYFEITAVRGRWQQCHNRTWQPINLHFTSSNFIKAVRRTCMSAGLSVLRINYFLANRPFISETVQLRPVTSSLYQWWHPKSRTKN